MNEKKVDLSKFNNISEYILKNTGYTSGSDMEDPKTGIVENAEKTKIKLYECGPRLDLKVIKIEEGFMKGNVSYHNYGINNVLFTYHCSKED